MSSAIYSPTFGLFSIIIIPFFLVTFSYLFFIFPQGVQVYISK